MVKFKKHLFSSLKVAPCLRKGLFCAIKPSFMLLLSSVVLSALLADVIPFMSSFPFPAKVVLEMAHTNYKPELQITVGHRIVGDKI